MKVILAGDVMTGRGLDQVMASPGDPTLYEASAKSALDYVTLAERRNGPIPRAVDPAHIWGEALEILVDGEVSARIINLETAVTDGGEPWPGKGIHYRMNPANVDCLSVARIDACVLANNHVLDWSYPGLDQTLDSIHRAGIATAGAGRDASEAYRPAVVATGASRLILVALAAASSGVPSAWAAGTGQPGVAFAEALSETDLQRIGTHLASVAQPGDVIVASIHWGGNWGYQIPPRHRDFAHRLIDEAGVHIVHGHSSHHPLGIEVYRQRLILYGCGDLLNDYEGIGGYEQFHPDLGLIYLAVLDPVDGRLEQLELVAMRMRRFRLETAPAEEVAWLAATLTGEGERFGTAVEVSGPPRLRVRW